MKVRCSNYRCNWRGVEDEILTAPNPFMEAEVITACPKCKEVYSVTQACDEPHCWEFASCGTPTETGYRRTCGAHMPKGKDEKVH